MADTSFRAGSGSYQAVRTLDISPSTVVALNPLVETYVGATRITGGSIADLTTDSLVYVNWANPLAANNVGLKIISACISATGTLQLTYWNTTGSNISPSAGTQINIIVF